MKHTFLLTALFLFCTSLFAQDYHDTQGKLDISSSGQATYTLPIAMPPSISSVGPTINLVYASGQAGGIAGQGWNINSLSAITRMATRMDIDGFIDGVDFDDNDKLALDGQRLLLQSGNYWEDGSIYETEVWSNTKIQLKGSGATLYFIVTTPDGSRSWYGNYGSANAADASAYYITRFEDAEGNFIVYNYNKPLNKNLCIDTIQFSANVNGNTTPLNYIKFGYTSAVRTERAYFKGALIEKAELLNNIKVYTNGLLFREYAITHTTDPQLGYQRVAKIQEKNGAGELANPVEFTYDMTTSTNVNSEVTKSYANNIYFNNAKLGGDFDGDGRLDFVADNNLYTKVFDGNSGMAPTSIPFNVNERTTFAATTLSAAPSLPAYKLNQFQSLVNAVETTNEIRFGVYNKIPDNAVYLTNELQLNYSKVIAFDNNISVHEANLDNTVYKFGLSTTNSDGSPRCLTECFSQNTTENCAPPTVKSTNKYLEGDFNGDGISEVLIIRKVNERYYYQTTDTRSGTYYETPGPFSFSPPVRHYYHKITCEVKTVDDGEEFYLVNTHPNASTQLGTAGYVKFPDLNPLVGDKRFVMDFNSDGKADVLVVNNNGTYKVVSFKQLLVAPWIELEVLGQGSLPHYNNNKQILFGDYNGDGKTDIMMPNKEGDGCEDESDCDDWYIYYSNPKPAGGSFFEEQFQDIVRYMPVRNYNLSTINNSYYALDVNKDGKTDLVRVERVYYKPSWTINDHNTRWTVSTYINNIGNGGAGFNSDYTSPCISFSYSFNGNTSTFQVCDHNSDNNWFPIPIASSYKNNGMNNELVMVQEQNQTATYIKFTKDFNRDNNLISVRQSGGAIVDEISYQSMEPGVANQGLGSGTDFYSSLNVSNYPSVELRQVPSMRLVSQLKNTALGISRFQDFKYNGYVINVGRIGVIGFNKTARSSWYLANSNKKTWAVSINNPLFRGANIKNYSVMLNSGINFDFNASYSAEKLSSTDNDFTQNTDTASYRYSILLQRQTTTDYLTNVINEKIYNTYSADYLLPTSVTSKNYLGAQLQGETTTQTTYSSNVCPTCIGSNHYIGRPTEINTTSTVYVNTPISGTPDTKTSKEKFTYTNGNITRIEKTPNNDPVTLVETMTYFPNSLLKSKTISATGTADAIALTPRTVSYTYDSTNRFIKTTTDADLMVTTNLTYHLLYGTVLTQQNPYLQLTTNVYDNWGKRTKVTDFLGYSVKYSYTRSNNIYTTTQTGDDGSSSIIEQDVLAREVRKGSKNINNVWSYIKTEYDNWGRKYRTSEPYYGTTSPTLWNTTEYDDYSRPVKTTAHTGKVTKIIYTGLTVTANDGVLTKTLTKNANGQTIENTDEPGGIISYKYDAMGNMVESDYDGITTKITYDNFGRKKQLVDTSADTYTYGYNAFGEIISEGTPKGITKYTYTPVGKVLTKSVQGLVAADGTNITTTYNYDPTTKLLNSMTVANPNDGNSTYAYTYDSNKRLYKTVETLNMPVTNTTFATFTKELAFDILGRIETETNTATAHGQSSSKVIKNSYSAVNGELVQKKDNVTNANIWQANSVNARGQLTNASFGNGITVTNAYDVYGFPTQNKHGLGTTDVMTLDNVFEPTLGNLISRKNSMFANIEHFDYDSLDRLYQWDVSGANDTLINCNFETSTEGFTYFGTPGAGIVTYGSGKLKTTSTEVDSGAEKLILSNATIGQKIKIQADVVKTGGIGLVFARIIERDPTSGYYETYDLNIANNLINQDYTVMAYTDVYIQFYVANDPNYDPSTGIGDDSGNMYFSCAFTVDNLVISKYNSNSQNYDDRGRITDNNLGTYNYNKPARPYQNTSVTLTDEAKTYYYSRSTLSISYNAFKAPIEIAETGKDRISFGYNTGEDRCIMYYGSTATDKLTRPYRKYYSADGSMEIKATFATGNTATPTAVEFVTYIGGDAYSAPVIYKLNYDAATPSGDGGLFYLHRDYQGSIMAITNATGAIVEKRMYDPWGKMVGYYNSITGATTPPTGAAGLFIDRGYTGHEHLLSVVLINMNARLYDPVVHRFLQPDNHIQDPSNTQNYNRYGYCLNNPLKYTDISGNSYELLTAVVVAVAVAILSYTVTALLADVPFTVDGLLQSSVIAAASAVVTYGIGSVCSTISNFYVRAGVSALAHGTFQGGMTAAQGGKFWAGFAAGAISSLVSSAWQGGNSTSSRFETNGNLTEGHFITQTIYHKGIGGALGATNTTIGTIAFGTISGGAAASLSGGNFWQGAVTGLFVSAFNHTMHDVIDPPGKKEPSPFMKRIYNSWFCKNQYFDAEAGLRVGTYIDFTPFKNVFGIKIGEYRQSSYNASFYDNNGSISQSDNHFFEFAASYGVGFDYKYNLTENRFESFSLSFFGISAEYSVQSSYQSQFYIGVDTGISIGLGIGGFAGVKGGWRFNF